MIETHPGDQAVGPGRLRPGAGGDEEDPRGPPKRAHHPADHPALRGAGQDLPLLQRRRHRRPARELRRVDGAARSGSRRPTTTGSTTCRPRPSPTASSSCCARPAGLVGHRLRLLAAAQQPAAQRHAHPGAPGRPAGGTPASGRTRPPSPAGAAAGPVLDHLPKPRPERPVPGANKPRPSCDLRARRLGPPAGQALAGRALRRAGPHPLRPRLRHRGHRRPAGRPTWPTPSSAPRPGPRPDRPHRLRLASPCLGAKAALAVGNDTGPLHLAAAGGAPTIVLFSKASDPALSAPRGRVAILQAEQPGRPACGASGAGGQLFGPQRTRSRRLP